jgi:hypothetical protein
VRKSLKEAGSKDKLAIAPAVQPALAKRAFLTSLLMAYVGDFSLVLLLMEQIHSQKWGSDRPFDGKRSLRCKTA